MHHLLQQEGRPKGRDITGAARSRQIPGGHKSKVSEESRCMWGSQSLPETFPHIQRNTRCLPIFHQFPPQVIRTGSQLKRMPRKYPYSSLTLCKKYSSRRVAKKTCIWVHRSRHRTVLLCSYSLCINPSLLPSLPLVFFSFFLLSTCLPFFSNFSQNTFMLLPNIKQQSLMQTEDLSPSPQRGSQPSCNHSQASFTG